MCAGKVASHSQATGEALYLHSKNEECPVQFCSDKYSEWVVVRRGPLLDFFLSVPTEPTVSESPEECSDSEGLGLCILTSSPRFSELAQYPDPLLVETSFT